MNSTTFKSILLTMIVALLIAAPGFGQTAITTTTLSAALDGTNRTFAVASATGIVVGDLMVIDREAMEVVSISGTNITVVRGVAGSRADNHANSRIIYHEVPAGFIQTDLAGTCTAASEFPNFTPLINTRTGNRYVCTNSVWTLSAVDPFTIGDSEARDVGIYIDGNTQDFHVALDDSADDLVFGVGTAAGTTTAFAIDEDQATTFTGGVTLASETTTAADTLTASQCGLTVFLNNATGYATTLPAPVAGCQFRFIDVTLLTSGDHTIVTNASANIIAGGCNELEVDTSNDGPSDTNGDTITFVGTLDSLGDIVEVISDGTLWIITFCQSGLDGGFTVAGS